MNREREAFEKEFAQTEFYRNKADLYSLLADINDEPLDFFRKNGFGEYSIGEAQAAWSAWQAAKAQAVPDTYTPIVLALEDVQSKIAKTSFLTMDEENENEVMAVDANELAAYIDELIEAQEPTND